MVRAPRPPRASPARFAALHSRPLTLKRRGLVGGGCLRGGGVDCPASAPGIPRSFRCAALAPPYAEAKGACWWLFAWWWG